MDFPASVAPFILRGITLVGIDSVMRPIPDRLEAWQRLADTLDSWVYDDISNEINLEQVISTAEQLISGEVRGRVVVKIAP
jgi:acrylyl-CoA reductase (NADPH)